MVKIIAGRWRGKILFAPEGLETRPTTARIKENIFNILAHADWSIPFDGAKVLDLCAGTGQLGFECLSRGATWALFVDNGIPARAALRKNIESLHAEGITKVYSRSIDNMGDIPPHAKGFFDFVFCDAPYHTGLWRCALQSMIQGQWVTQETIFIIEIAADENSGIEDTLCLLDERVYGDTKILFLKQKQ